MTLPDNRASSPSQKEKAVMKHSRIHIPLSVAFIIMAVGISIVVTRPSRGQSPATQKTESLVKPTVLVPSAAKPAAPFAEASAQNIQLRSGLLWAFGSKQQHGWYLYDSLIGQTFRMGFDSSSPTFASTIADWQKQKNLNATG